MNDVKKGDLAKLTFDEFRDRFSTGEGFLGQTIQTQEPPYYSPNEYLFSGIFDNVSLFLEDVSRVSSNPNIGFYGIIGGVDLTLSYIAAVNPDSAFLTDINKTAVDYLKSRLDIFERTDTPQEYFEILENENPRAMEKIRLFVENLPAEERKKVWYFNGGFDVLKNMVKGGRIKAFQSDYYGKGQEVMTGLIEDLNPDAVVFYLSDIGNVPSNCDQVRNMHRGNESIVGRLFDRNIPFMFIESGATENFITMLYDGQER